MQLNDLVKPLAGGRQRLDCRRLNSRETSLLAAVGVCSVLTLRRQKNGYVTVTCGIFASVAGTLLCLCRGDFSRPSTRWITGKPLTRSPRAT